MIGITLKKFQDRAVSYLFDKTTSEDSKSKIVMQSPTGSGKTIILVSYVERYLDYNKEAVVCWLSPGKGELEQQSKIKMERFAPQIKTGDVFDILNTGFVRGTTYFINWEKITKKGNESLKEGEKSNLFDRISEAHKSGINFILIIDEEHNNNTKKADDIISAIKADYEIRVSATPIKKVIGEFYQIPEIDVINEGLITKFININIDLETTNTEDIYNEAYFLLKKADEVRKEIRQAYIEEGENINPLVLIQFPNLNAELIKYVENKLEEMGYNYDNKAVASWFSEDSNQEIGKINLDNIEKNDSEQSFLLFKQAIATGWDCPRSKILVKLRENMGETFEIQTIGRLRRMPKAKHYDKEILDCAYIYTFDERYKLELLTTSSAFESRRLFLKDEAKSIKLKKEFRNHNVDYQDDRKIKNTLIEGLSRKYSLKKGDPKNREKMEIGGYKFGTIIERKILKGKYSTLMEIHEDTESYQFVGIEVDTTLHGRDLLNYTTTLGKILDLKYETTNKMLRLLFSDNRGLLNLNTREYYAFILNNLYKIKEDISEIVTNLSKQLQFIDAKEAEFKIPEFEHYRYNEYEKNTRVMNTNVYKEYNTAMITADFRSTSERLFEKYCESNDNVKFVYKNGDKGEQYLSIVYGNGLDNQMLFYPDYIVQLKDNSIWIIETKGGEVAGVDKNIDGQVKNKFEYLREFAKKHKYNFGFVRDKNDYLYLNNTQYIDDMDKDNWIPIEQIF